MDQIKPYLAKADTFLSKYPLLVDIETKTKVPKVYFAGSLWLIITASLFTNVLAGVVSALIALVYPTYGALEAITKSDVSKVKIWAFYFILLGLVNFLELGVDIVSSVIPFYYVFKTVFVLWLFVPHYLVRFYYLLFNMYKRVQRSSWMLFHLN